MARQKKTSAVIEKAELRIASLKSIGNTLDFNGGLTVANYEAKVAEAKAMLEAYNTKLSELDGMLNAYQDKEQEVRSFSTRMLAAVAAAYGKESSEYEQAGGTRTSEHG